MHIALDLPATIMDVQSGLWLFRRLTEMQFRRLLIVLMLVSGMLLGAGELF